MLSTALWQDAAFKATHVEEQIWIVLTVHRYKAGIPLDCGYGAWQSVLDVPKHSSSPRVGEYL